MDRTRERSTMRKVYLRLLPFAVLSYVLAYIDRINVSFAEVKDNAGKESGLGDKPGSTQMPRCAMPLL